MGINGSLDPDLTFDTPVGLRRAFLRSLPRPKNAWEGSIVGVHLFWTRTELNQRPLLGRGRFRGTAPLNLDR